MPQERWIAAPDATARVAARLARALAPPACTYEAWIVDGHVVGWIIPERAERLAEWRAVFRRSKRGVELAPALVGEPARTAALDEVARALSREGALSAWRDERYAVTPFDGGGAPLLAIERAAARYFGIRTFAAHANGLVGEPRAWTMWVARRSPIKPIDPGLLDNLVGGGVALGSDADATLTREAFEEAGIPSELARRARRAATLEICRDQPDGLQRETIHAYDLWLSADFVPSNQDGEAVEHRRCAPEEVVSILESDDVTADSSLVIVDFLLRHRHVAEDDPSRRALDELRSPRAAIPLRRP